MDEKIFNAFFPIKFPNWKHAVVVTIAIGLALFLSACNGSSAASKNANADNANQSKIISTKTVAASVRDVPKFIEATGTFQADESTDVAAETSGKVAQTLVGEGDFVSTGDVLVRLDERDASLRLQQSRAAESQARAQVTQAEAQFRQSQASLGLDKGGNFTIDNIPAVLQSRATLVSRLSDLKLAESTEKRYTNLLETGDTSRLVVDQRRNETEKARAAVNEARENQKAAENTARQSNQAIAASRANVQNAQAAIESAQSATALAAKTVADTTIRAPFSGYVSARAIAVGENVSPTTPIVTIVRANPIKIRLQVPEKEAGQISVGLNVSATVAAYTDRNFAGRVSAVNPLVNATSRSLQVEVLLENSQNILRPGMFGTARILQPSGDKGIFVPKAALVPDTKTDTLGVYVIDGDSARLRTVLIDESTRELDEIRVLTGVNEGENVATTNAEQLFDGVKVISE
ncbi:MAG: efflux RND transporter periplasmic adaptor subunit [Acidobacteriota bacterium]|nr:efflux RND transporter periplasmic adaptor subunit [Acidobacteriota bacterium]